MRVIEAVRRGIITSSLALFALFGPSSASAADAGELVLTVALVEDPDFPSLDEALVKRAFDAARAEFTRRFDYPAPKFYVKYRFDVDGFLGAYSNPRDPQCRSLYRARYKGGGKKELGPHREKALRFLKKWSIESLKGFIENEETKKRVSSYEEIYDYYVDRYTKTVSKFASQKTPKGTPLVRPGTSEERSFVAWMCALKRQEDSDVVITNTFILSDLLTEPHPHSVFGKAKIGGIAMPTKHREALGHQVLLATTFGIDTQIEELSELGGKPATFDERAKILGAYLVAHEVAHAVFGIPDVFDHPLGCLMTSRPGATYRDGIEELDAHPEPCSSCRPYVNARKVLDQGRAALADGKPKRARRLLLGAAKKVPKHFHGGRRARISEIVLLASRASMDSGREKEATKFAKLAVRLNPRSRAAADHLELLKSRPLRDQTMAIVASAATSTKTKTKTSTTGR